MLEYVIFYRILCYSFAELQAHSSVIFFRIRRTVICLEEIFSSITLALYQVGQQRGHPQVLSMSCIKNFRDKYKKSLCGFTILAFYVRDFFCYTFKYVFLPLHTF